MNLSGRQWHKIAGALIIGGLVPVIVYIQLQARAETASQTVAHILGLAPNFLAGIAVPFAILIFDPGYETPKTRRFWYYNFTGFLLLVVHEYERFTAGHAFDWQDLAASAAGILIADALYFGLIAPFTQKQ